MELNVDLTAIQGILTSVVKSTGEFSKIIYKGGNEMKINLVIKELEEYLISKQYLEKRKANKRHQNELESITLFLILNSQFKSNVLMDIKEFSHLQNIVPSLSKCLFANVIIELDLLEYCCAVIYKLPLEISAELILEFVPCIRQISIKQCLEYSHILLMYIINKLSSADSSVNKVNDITEKLQDISSEILLNMSGINPEQIQGWSKLKVYKHMGVTLIKLLKLLQFCQLENLSLQKIIESLLSTTCSVIKAVTIKVYCGWAEVHYKEQVLQTVISSEAHYVLEKYHKYEPAQQLIQMLASFAKKPKTLAEMIQEADITAIITNVNECNSNQKPWFTALLNCSQVLENDDALNCIKRWSKLCTLEDVTRLLNLSKTCKNAEVQKLIITCASQLNEFDLMLAISRFFHQHGLRCCLNFGEIQTDLTKVLNQLEHGKCDIFKKQILLLLLQNPNAVVTQMFKECIKNQVMLTYLKDIIKDLSNIIQIESLSTTTLENMIQDMKPSAENITNYETLCQLIIANTFSGNKLVESIIKNYTETCWKKEYFSDLKYSLDLYYYIIDKNNNRQYSTLFLIAIKILENCRWNFFDFSFMKADLCEKCVCISLDYIKFVNERQISLTEEVQSVAVEHYLNKYYISQLHKPCSTFFEYACPLFNPDNQAESVCFFIKLLPICVPQEVFNMCKQLNCCYGYEKLLELLTDTVMLICDVAKTQQDNHNARNCLKYCVQIYGTVIKNIVAPLKNLKADVHVNKSICRLLREIPTDIKNMEGMSLLSLMTEESLKSLVQDKSFICLLAAIQDTNISQVIAKKMIS